MGESSLLKALQIREHVVHLFLGIPAELFRMLPQRIVPFNLHCCYREGMAPLVGVDDGDGKFIALGEPAGDGLAGRRCDNGSRQRSGGYAGRAVARIQHALH